MSDNAQSNITEILNTFDKLIYLVENPNWVKNAKVEEIKTAFKLGLYVEKVVKHFDDSESSQFFNILYKWWKNKKHYKLYNKQFFEVASDRLLGIFFQCENISENILDIAVRVYTSLYNCDRFKSFLSTLILYSSSVEAVADFIKFACSDSDLIDLQYTLLLQNWTNLYQTKREDVVKDNISNMLAAHKVNTSLHILIGIISIDSVQEPDTVIQYLILKILLDKMTDRSALSKDFWLTLCKSVDPCLICTVCAKYDEFLKSFLNFLVYIGSLMRKECGIFWTTDSLISFCPEIEYSDVLRHLKNLLRINNSVRQIILDRLLEAKSETHSDIWDSFSVDLLYC